MTNARFKIFDAVRDAYVFVGREWPYLLKIGVPPMAAQILFSLFVQYAQEDASLIESYLWGLPATFVFAWYMFLETRLLLLGEKANRLPSDPVYLARFQRGMQASVLSSLLCNMALAALVAADVALVRLGHETQNALANFGALALTGAVFWGLRFGIVPILLAVGYPATPVLQRVRGMGFSFRLVGMGMLCLFPVVFLYQAVTVAMLGEAADPTSGIDLTDAQRMAMILIGAPFSLAVSTLLNAATCCALQQILGPGGRT